ncbi:MAG TPA: hypothetical protein VHK28_03470 [Candidatus Limnocylindria bacterium]|nr:hypothetical protein [Candidatus Limnocylindria bacterium]
MLVLALTFVPAARVLACSCMDLPFDEHVALADLAVVGVVGGADEVRIDEGNGLVSMGTTYTLVVEEVLKGEVRVGEAALFHSEVGTCGMAFSIGQRWRMTASRQADTYVTSICSGNELLAENVPVPAVAPAVEEDGGGPGEIPAGVLLALGGFAMVAVVSVVAFGRAERKTSS